MTLTANPSGAADVLPLDGRTVAPGLTEAGVRMIVYRGDERLYSNGQVDDYAGLPRSRFPHAAPLRLELRARFSHEAAGPGAPGLQGTAGFGFWNDPFMMTDPRPPMPPRALWFFYASPPSDMKLAIKTPGWGWKAAVIDALQPAAIGPALAAPLLVPLMNLPAIYRHVWPVIQPRLGIAETLVHTSLTDWHTYTIEWGAGPARNRARFLVDAALVLDAPAPRGRLGFVAWCDNQYMIARPTGRIWRGLLKTGEQWLEVADIGIEALGREEA